MQLVTCPAEKQPLKRQFGTDKQEAMKSHSYMEVTRYSRLGNLFTVTIGDGFLALKA